VAESVTIVFWFSNDRDNRRIGVQVIWEGLVVKPGVRSNSC